MERAKSMRTGETRVPKAESTLALTGKITRSLSSSSATPQAWTGPAPPKAITVTPRRSTPCSTPCMRAAAAMFWLTTSWIPAAVSIAGRPSPRASSETAPEAREASRGMSPPRKAAGSSRPSTTSASVTAATSPPSP